MELRKGTETVLTAGGGEEAVEIFQQHKKEIAVVVLDIVMPGVDGRESSGGSASSIRRHR
ncbi:MAG: hypothetical protein AABZ15_06085 [Nitrospirota bacterium]